MIKIIKEKDIIETLKGSANEYSKKYRKGDKVKFKHPGGVLSPQTATIVGYDEDGFYTVKWDDNDISYGLSDVNLVKVVSKDSTN